MIIIIDNILTPYEIARYNAINRIINGNLEVWFCQRNKKEDRKSFPKIQFKYKEIKYFGFEAIVLLNNYKKQLERIVYCGWNSWVYLYAFWFCKRNGIRSTLWSGSTVFEGNFFRMISLPLVKYLVKNTDDYLAYGTRAKEYLIRLGAKEDKIKIFLNSVDCDYFQKMAQKLKKRRFDLRNKFNIPLTDTIFLYVGQLIARKGIKELMKAFEKVHNQHKDITLVIAGDGALKNEILSFIREKHGVKIRYLGYREYNQLPEVYAVSDVLVLPSKEEVWGLVVNEALSCGIPVLVSQFAGSSVDLIDKENGEIIDDISVGGIAKFIDRFLEKNKKYVISSSILEKMKNETYAKKIFAT
jgi:glycosyltransferase involved in cell wall biosynthesis